MLLDEREIDLLARFLAKRFPGVDDRRPVLERAGMPDSAVEGPVAAWGDIVARAQQSHELARLGRALRIDDPDDVNLREVRRLLDDEPRKGWNLPAATLGAIAAMSVVLVAGVSWAVGGHVVRGPLAEAPKFAAQEPRINPITTAPVEHVAVAAVSEEPEVVPVPEVAPVKEAPPKVAPRPAPKVAPPTKVVAPVTEAAPVLEVAHQGDVPPVREPGTERHVAPDHCARKDGDVGGWWYVGDEIPGKVGDVIVVPHDAYVRAEVPSVSNGYARTAVRCVLYAGDKVRLTGEPVLVPVGAYWVSTTSGDVVVAGGRRVRDRG